MKSTPCIKTDVALLLSDNLEEMTVDEKVNNDAILIFNKMKRQIESVYRKLSGFNRSYEDVDYMQEAFLACRDAVIRFSEFHHSKDSTEITHPDTISVNSKMQLKTYAFWYILKKLQLLADVKEVEYQIFDKQGKFLETLTNKEFRKTKTKIGQSSYNFKSVKITLSHSELEFVYGNRTKEYDPADQRVIDPFRINNLV